MKHMKILAPALMLACVVTLALGGGSASAVTWCKEAKNPCPEAQQYASGTTIHSLLTIKSHAALTTSIGTVTCQQKTRHGHIRLVFFLKTTHMTIWNCSLGSTACSVTVQNLPYNGTGSASATVGNGTVVEESSGVGSPQMRVECGSFINCTFRANALTSTFTGGSPALLTTNQVMEREGGLCPSTSTLESQEEVASPKPLFITKEP
jgi:hypothetical protein